MAFRGWINRPSTGSISSKIGSYGNSRAVAAVIDALEAATGLSIPGGYRMVDLAIKLDQAMNYQPFNPAGRAGMQFLRAGGPQGLLLGLLMAYATYELSKWLNNGGPMHHPGFSLVNTCTTKAPEARLFAGSPWPCLGLIATGGFHSALNAPYTSNERATGMQEIELCNPFVGRYCSVRTFRPDGVAAGDAPVTLQDDDPFGPHRSRANHPRGPAIPRDRFKPWIGNPPKQQAKSAMDPDVIDTKGLVPPEIDPMSKPIGWFMPRAIILPWRLVAARRDERGDRIAPETSTQGYSLPRADEPRRVIPTHPNAVVPVVIVKPGGTTIDKTRPLVRAGARTHERKMKTPMNSGVGAVWMKIFGQVTEAGDLIDAMYNALPLDVRREDFFANGRHDLSSANKVESLYDNYKRIDLTKMVTNIAFQQVQDELIGRMSGDIAAGSGGSPIGRTLSALGK